MNIRYKRYRLLFTLGALLLLAGTAQAQFKDAGEIIRAGKADANTLMEAYLKPFGNGFGAGLNSGWISGGKPHSALGFDLSFRAGGALVPDGDLTFNVQDLDLQELEYAGGPVNTPTISGDNITGAEMKLTATAPDGNDYTLADFNIPQGVGFRYVPTMMIQGGLGIGFGTDITLRYFPESKVPRTDAKFSLKGLSIRHSINEWLPGGKMMPVNLSLQAGYTNLNSTTDLNVDPQVDNNTENSYSPDTWDGQQLDFDTKSFTINAIAGKSLILLDVFAGVGYESSKVEISTPGQFPITTINQDYNPNEPNSKQKKIKAVDKPIDLSFNGSNHIRALVGFGLNLGPLNINATYTQAAYSMLNFGVGVSIR